MGKFDISYWELAVILLLTAIIFTGKIIPVFFIKQVSKLFKIFGKKQSETINVAEKNVFTAENHDDNNPSCISDDFISSVNQADSKVTAENHDDNNPSCISDDFISSVNQADSKVTAENHDDNNPSCISDDFIQDEIKASESTSETCDKTDDCKKSE